MGKDEISLFVEREGIGMRKQAYNPYLPSWEHVPDGEPHVFGDKVYIYGSHDRSHGTTFCMEDYVCWSAPVDDLGNWKYEGVIWKKTDDPNNRNPTGYLYAPDVAQGPDGRYYLYYFACNDGKKPYDIGVAVCDTPAGKYEYYATLKLTDEEQFIPFDPAIFVDDDRRVWLYYGSAFQMGGKVLRAKGGAVVELAQDMKTVLTKPKLTVPNVFHQRGTGFEGHAFFEASSMRKMNGTYYLVYSSMVSHELCYATAKRPDGPFTYGGVVVSNGDIGYQGNKRALAPTGNNHGGMECINGQWYIFYHRHTQGSSYSRQGCAEKISILSDGSIPQAEITSCGLNDGPLIAEGVYPADICCNLTDGRAKKRLAPTCVDEERNMEKTVSFVSNMKDGSEIGYKYFTFSGKTKLTIRWRVSLKDCGLFQTLTPHMCKADGTLYISTESVGAPIAEISLKNAAGDWEKAGCVLNLTGVNALYFCYHGKGAVDIKDFSLSVK